jgi:hypothetical protein
MIASPTFSDLHALDQHFLIENLPLLCSENARQPQWQVGRTAACPAKRFKAEEEVKAEELEVKVEDVPLNAAGCGSMPPRH